ncbi:hypothetical protein EXU57_08240 [Segetibacter sp. 3557_3]|uniref:DUF6958 family protein n=1 Tax=Segetibacter sp. 3557_3 TaxID=2547429 RepID=UPI00105841E3|nr:hypothetical protein [Segetibacter sp. 3557_3]TDH26791.1 hypothetical protein EXU57_08240 [Segetibacter sp. 3557_3]
MKAEKILTLHPQGKSGKNISLEKYDVVKQAMLQVLHQRELTHTELMDEMTESLTGKFTDNIGWYSETIKLDLEAKAIIERTTHKPQKYRLKQGNASGIL